MDSTSSTKLRVKITYNIGGSSQLRLARLPPTTVSLLDFSESCNTPSSSTSLLDRYVELPLGVCLAAVKQASPELMSDGSQDYSVYVRDPTEDVPNGDSNSADPRGVLVGKGLLSTLNAESETVCGQVVKDGIRGESVLIQLVLETANSARIAPASQPVASFQPQNIPQGQPNTNNVDALLSFLTNVATTGQMANGPNNIPAAVSASQTAEVTQLLSALANCCGLDVPSSAFATKGSEGPQSVPASDNEPQVKSEPEVIDITQDWDVVEVAAPPSKSATPESESEKVKQLNKASAGSSYYPTRVLAGYPQPGSSAQKSTTPVDEASGKNKGKSKAQTPALSNNAPLSSITNASSTVPPVGLHSIPPVPTMHARPTFQPAALYLPPGSAPPIGSSPLFVTVPPQKNQKVVHLQPFNTSGPNGNGWYRRSGLPPAPSSDLPEPELAKPIKKSVSITISPGKENGIGVEKAKGKTTSKKRVAAGEPEDKARNKRMKHSREVSTSPVRPPPKTTRVNALVCAATSPVRPQSTWKSKDKDQTKPVPTGKTPTSPSLLLKLASSLSAPKPAGSSTTSQAPVRTLNFLSNRLLSRSQSESQPYTMKFFSDELYKSQPQSRMYTSGNPYLPAKNASSAIRSSVAAHSKATAYAASPSESPRTPTTSLTSLSSSSASLSLSQQSTSSASDTLTSEDGPRTPPRHHQLALPDVHHRPSKPALVAPASDDVIMADAQDAEEGGSPLFLPSPDDPSTARKRSSVAEPSSPTPTRRRSLTPKAHRVSVPRLSLTIPPSDSMVEDERSAPVTEGAKTTQEPAFEDEFGPPPAKPFDFSALGLPPSSPPSSLASSDVSSSPGERWSSLEIEGEGDGQKNDVVGDAEQPPSETNVNSDSGLCLTGMEPRSETSQSEDSAMTTNVPSSDASSIEFDYDALMNMLGMCQNATGGDEAKSQEISGFVNNSTKTSLTMDDSQELDLGVFLRSDPSLEYLSYGQSDCSSSLTVALDSMAVEPSGEKNDLSWLTDILGGKGGLLKLPVGSEATVDDSARGSSIGFDDESFKEFVDAL
ncbi:hypothetical protein FRC02_011298 [Tulasnella sp. 418]|nr:hypothetical protein FRC02_011298 [Tulasnella sp. 418]